MASYDLRNQEMFHLNEWEDHLYPHALKVVWENYLTHLRSIASDLMSFSKCYLYRRKSSEPLPPSALV